MPLNFFLNIDCGLIGIFLNIVKIVDAEILMTDYIGHNLV